MPPFKRRRIATTATLALLCLSVILAGYRAGPGAPAPDEPEPLVDFVLTDARADDAIALLSDRHGVRVLFDEKMPERVSCTFRRIRLSEALVTLAGADRYCVVRDGRTYRITRRLGSADRSVTPGVAGAICSAGPSDDPLAAPGPARPVPAGSRADDEELDFLAAMIGSGRAKEALPLLSAFAGKHPEDARVHTLLGNAYRERRMLVSAEKAWRRALELDPANPELRNGAIQLRKVLGEVRAERAKSADRSVVAALDAYLM